MKLIIAWYWAVVISAMGLGATTVAVALVGIEAIGPGAVINFIGHFISAWVVVSHLAEEKESDGHSVSPPA